MLNWCFYNAFSEDVNEDFWYFKKHKNLHFSKSKKTQNTEYNQKQWSGRTRNKHCNLMIFTVPLNRIRIEHRYYNIQPIKYHNNADLMVLQYIFRRRQRRLLILRKTQKFALQVIKKIHQISGKTVGKWQIDNIHTTDTNSTLI